MNILRLTIYASCMLLPDLAAAQTPSVTVWFREKQAEVSDKLALLCADNQATVVEQDDRHVLCSRPVKGLAATFAFGMGRGASVPQLMVRFNLLKDKTAVRVQAAQWVQNEGPFGQARRRDLTDQKSNASLEEKLLNAGGHNYLPELDAPSPDHPAD